MSTPDSTARKQDAGGSGRHSGKRLSPWRVTLGVLVVAAVIVGGLFSFRVFVIEQVRADSLAPWFAGYADVTATPRYAFENPSSTEDRDAVLAFVVAKNSTSCVPSWGAAYSLDEAGNSLDLDRRIARLRQNGGDVMVSFGGANNTELATACTSVDSLANAYTAVIDRYEVSTIDLDIERDNLADMDAATRRASAIAQLQMEQRAEGKDLGVWLTLPIALDGLTPDGMNAVSTMLAAGVDLAGVNAMTMDYAVDLQGKTMAQAAIGSLHALHRQLGTLYSRAGSNLTDATLWSKVSATPMIGQNDVPGEVFTLDDARTLNAFGQDKQFGRMSMWSLNRDATCAANYADVRIVSDACSGVDQGTETFAELLSSGFSPAPPGRAPSTSSPRPTVTPTDDPATSPYPVWSETSTYLAGTKVVWHGNVYIAKWWTRGDVPDDPVRDATQTPWTLIGPVLPGEAPYTQQTLPAGTYPEWSGTQVYVQGDRVLFQGVPYEAKWWTQGNSPAAASADVSSSPWTRLTDKQIAAIREQLYPSPTPAPAG